MPARGASDAGSDDVAQLYDKVRAVYVHVDESKQNIAGLGF